MHPRFTASWILMSAATLALTSCRIINGKPDFHWIGDQFTPAIDDSVFVDRGVGALDIPATETIPPAEAAAPVPAPLPPAVAPQEATAGSVAQKQPEPEVKAPAQPIVYNVVAGDTLSGIAARHKTKTKVLIEYNRLDINKPLQLNQKLLIPVNGATLPAPAPEPPAPNAQPSGEKPGYFSRLFGQNEQQPSQAASHKTYTVVAGDTLTAIARRHGTTTGTLIRLNQLDINKPLQINQKLLIPVSGAATPTASPRRAPMPKKQESPAPDSPTGSVSGILPPQETATSAQPSQPTQPEQPQTPPAPAAAAAASVYTIQAGDTLYGIARKLNISPEFLMNANGLTPETADKLRAGATLNLPPQKQP